MILYFIQQRVKERETWNAKQHGNFQFLPLVREIQKGEILILLLAFDPTQRCLHIVSAR